LDAVLGDVTTTLIRTEVGGKTGKDGSVGERK